MMTKEKGGGVKNIKKLMTSFWTTPKILLTNYMIPPLIDFDDKVSSPCFHEIPSKLGKKSVTMQCNSIVEPGL